MEVIKRWIDESDVYFLILGGRYGSIDPTTGKSYVQLEYEYAQERKKPFFAAVIEDAALEIKVRAQGSIVLETENPQKLREFRANVLTKLVKFWSDPRDIKLAVFSTLSDFARREELIGWMPGDQVVNTGALAEEIARLGKENASLREQLSKIATPQATFNGLTYEQVFGCLADIKLDSALLTSPTTLQLLQETAATFGDSDPSLLHLFWLLRAAFRIFNPFRLITSVGLFDHLCSIEEFWLITLRMIGTDVQKNHHIDVTLTDNGRSFLLQILLQLGIKEPPVHTLTSVDSSMWLL
jgi:Domain of unknown function (DUF4062)